MEIIGLFCCAFLLAFLKKESDREKKLWNNGFCGCGKRFRLMDTSTNSRYYVCLCGKTISILYNNDKR